MDEGIDRAVDISVAGMFGNTPRRDAGFIEAVAQTAEGLGLRALYAPEHVVFFASYDSKYPYSEDGSARWGPDTGIYDPLFVALIATRATTTLRFCTGVLILPQRPALLTAKEVMTLDHLSGGRFEFGVGSGWSWEEYEALGASFERRGARMDEYLDAMRAVWTEHPVTFNGEFIEFEDVVLNPKPVTEGGPPIIVGGTTDPAMRRAAGRGDGWYGWWPPHHDLAELSARLDEALEAAGRADDEAFSRRIGIPLGTETPDEIEAKVATAGSLGFDEVVLAGALATSTFEDELALYASLRP